MSAITKVNFSKGWNSMYEQEGFTDWETIGPENLKEFIGSVNVDKKQIKSIMEYGCGRGFRMLSWLLLDREINRDDVTIRCVDISRKAIEDAKNNLSQLMSGKFPDGFLKYCTLEIDNKQTISDEFYDMIKSGIVPKINCTIEFVNQDLFCDINNKRKYDLVIDWMCFHEIPPECRNDYINIISSVCGKYYILNAFSSENCIIPNDEFTDVTLGIPKYMFSREEIENYFKYAFKCSDSFVRWYPPTIKRVHKDGMIFPKMSYYMVRNNAAIAA